MIALVTLTVWLVPPMGRMMPHAWMLMKANTALAAFLSVVSLTLSQPKRSHRMLQASRLVAGLVTLIGIATLVEDVLNISSRLDTFLMAGAWLPHPSRMSPQTAAFFLILSLAMLLIRMRKNFLARMADLLIFLLCLLVLIIGAGHIFGASRLSGVAVGVRVSPQTLISMMLLAYVAVLRRAEYGIFAILLGVGIGSKIARIACPFALILPFMLEMGRTTAIQRNWISAPYATALAASLAAMLGFGLVVILAWRIDTLEKAIRDLSLRDELTRVYNRRGFYVLAEQALRLAQRSGVPFSVIFIDLDDLKQINDSVGHEIGSAFLAEVALLLKKSFRKSDVIGRIGGDEFVVAGESSADAIHLAVERLEKAAAEINTRNDRLYLLSFSCGHVTSDIDQEESLDDLLGKADRAMYRTKRRKKMLRDSNPDQLLIEEINGE